MNENPQKEEQKALPKRNILFIGISLLIIVIGFALMAGPASGETYNPDIFSFRRITIGPMIALGGFVSMIISILWKGKK